MDLENNQEFTGGGQGGVANIVIVGSATLEAAGPGPNGTTTWVEVPDGAGTDTVFSMYIRPGTRYRFTDVSDAVRVAL